MKNVFFWLRARLGVLVLLAGFGVIFSAMAWLGGMGLDNVLYAALLCATLALLIGFFDCRRYLARHRALQELATGIALSLDGLPEAASLVEQDYQALLAAMRRDKAESVSQMDQKLRDMTAYYTLWAHQIKTPIAAMRLLLQQNAASEQPELTQELFRIEQYVDMVLQYLRLDSDSTDYVIRRCQLDGIVRQAVRKYAPQFIRKKLTLHYEPLQAVVLTDEKWLLFVVEQLLSNALKYTQAGSISITLEPGPVLCITDTGMGIAPEDLPRIFENGFTGYNGRADKKATGIGLYLCRMVCRRLSHTLSVDSTPGEGTIVRIGLGVTERVQE